MSSWTQHLVNRSAKTVRAKRQRYYSNDENSSPPILIDPVSGLCVQLRKEAVKPKGFMANCEQKYKNWLINENGQCNVI